MEPVVHLKNLMPLWKRWSSIGGMVLWMCTIMGCGTGVLLQQEADGGVVQYLYQERTGHLLSSNRTVALDEITRHCAGPYTMIQEGPTRGRKRVVQGVAGVDVITESWWGIRFRCQTGSKLRDSRKNDHEG